MLRIIKTSIFDSPAQTLVNTVNTVGVMGKGIAKEFKARYPAMFREYKSLCDERSLEMGALHVWRGPSRWVLNFPTKTTWKKPSQLDYIENGLQTFVQWYEEMGIRSVSFPPLGCGNGNLDWDDVRPLMLRYLWDLDIQIYIHDMQFRDAFQPEHNDISAVLPPVSFGEFVQDLEAIAHENHGHFKTLLRHSSYDLKIKPDGELEIFTDQKQVVGSDFLADAWVGLQLGLLTTQTFGDKAAQRAASYLMPVLAKLPYVSYTTVQVDPRNPAIKAIGLFFGGAPDGYDDFSVTKVGQDQRCLFQ